MLRTPLHAIKDNKTSINGISMSGWNTVFQPLINSCIINFVIRNKKIKTLREFLLISPCFTHNICLSSTDKAIKTSIHPQKDCFLCQLDFYKIKNIFLIPLSHCWWVLASVEKKEKQNSVKKWRKRDDKKI